MNLKPQGLISDRTPAPDKHASSTETATAETRPAPEAKRPPKTRPEAPEPEPSGELPSKVEGADLPSTKVNGPFLCDRAGLFRFLSKVLPAADQPNSKDHAKFCMRSPETIALRRCDLSLDTSDCNILRSAWMLPVCCPRPPCLQLLGLSGQVCGRRVVLFFRSPR